ncbi:YdhR family protein [Gymnodinialimonas sp. 2305UL16-5]|uniref:YdhR family protein n=1 Tax=Gymnodinialimonas mytili TaxID=3126503 RepID=UPI0030976868
MLKAIWITAATAAVTVTAVAFGLASQAPEKTVDQSFVERMANGGATLAMRGIAAGYYARSGVAVSEATGQPVMLQVNFTVVSDAEAFVSDMDGFAPFLSHVPGLTWKLWSYDPETGNGNGTYLFETRAHVDMYLNEVLPVGMMNDPRLADMEIQILDVLTGPSSVTRAM